VGDLGEPVGGVVAVGGLAIRADAADEVAGRVVVVARGGSVTPYLFSEVFTAPIDLTPILGLRLISGSHAAA
jgi:hypothetical protein